RDPRFLASERVNRGGDEHMQLDMIVARSTLGAALLPAGEHLGSARRHAGQRRARATPLTPPVRQPFTQSPLATPKNLPSLPRNYVKEKWKRQRKVKLRAVVRAIERSRGAIIGLART